MRRTKDDFFYLSRTFKNPMAEDFLDMTFRHLPPMQVFKADAAKEANVVPCEAWSECSRMLHLSFWQAHWGHPLQGYDAHVERYRTELGSEEHHPVVA